MCVFEVKPLSLFNDILLRTGCCYVCYDLNEYCHYFTNPENIVENSLKDNAKVFLRILIAEANKVGNNKDTYVVYEFYLTLGHCLD